MSNFFSSARAVLGAVVLSFVACGGQIDPLDEEPAPRCVGPGCRVVQVTSLDFAMCVARENGSVWCWGDDRAAQTGYLPRGDWCEVHKCRRPPRPVAIENARRVFGGGRFACALTADARAWCWGANGSGQLGHDPADDAACPDGACAPKPRPVPLEDVTRMSLAENTACAITSAGALSCWGSNVRGWLGLPKGAFSTPVPTRIAEHVVDVSIAPDAQHACWVLEDRSVVCAGSNDHGELGHPPGTLADVEVKSDLVDGPSRYTNDVGHPVLDASGGTLRGAIDVHAGRGYTCARMDDESTRCWGLFGAKASPLASPHAALRGARSLALGSDSAFWFGGGQVATWGTNARGTLALGDTMPRVDPMDCPGLSGAVQVSARGYSGIALGADGSVLTWGDNGAAQLGHVPGTLGDRLTCGNGYDVCNPTPARVRGL